MCQTVSIAPFPALLLCAAISQTKSHAQTNPVRPDTLQATRMDKGQLVEVERRNIASTVDLNSSVALVDHDEQQLESPFILADRTRGLCGSAALDHS